MTEMMDFTEAIKTGLNYFGISYTDEILKRLTVYADLILEFNRSLNLVSKTDPKHEIVKQIIDSSALIKYVEIKPNSTLLDLGSGGGFPGMVIKILRPDVGLFSLDASPKKVLFQEQVAGKLGLNRCEFIAKTLDEYEPRGGVDLVTTKALGKFKRVLAFASRFLKIDGRAVFYIGGKIPGAFDEAERKGLVRETVISYCLPAYPGKYQLVILKKIK
jgi:16S rRNA (guanine527-N7)-methyltransferase